MQRLVMPKSMTIFALTAGAAALSVLGATAAGAASGAPAPAPAAAAAPVSGAAAGDQQSAADPQMATDPQSAAAAQPAAMPQAASAPAAGSVNGRVVSDVPLRIRAQPTMNSAALGSYAPGTIVHLKCKVNGQTVDGNPRWYKLSDRTGWLAARYVVNLGNVPWC